MRTIQGYIIPNPFASEDESLAIRKINEYGGVKRFRQHLLVLWAIAGGSFLLGVCMWPKALSFALLAVAGVCCFAGWLKYAGTLRRAAQRPFLTTDNQQLIKLDQRWQQVADNETLAQREATNRRRYSAVRRLADMPEAEASSEIETRLVELLPEP